MKGWGCGGCNNDLQMIRFADGFREGQGTYFNHQLHIPVNYPTEAWPRFESRAAEEQSAALATLIHLSLLQTIESSLIILTQVSLSHFKTLICQLDYTLRVE